MSAGTELDEVRRLRRTVRDLVAIASLPALWVGLSPEAVLQSLSEALHQMLRGQWVYAVLRETAHGPLDRVICTASGDAGRLNVEALVAALGPVLDVDGQHQVADPFEPGLLRIFVAPVPVQDVAARLAFASHEVDFPREDQQLLINVAVNQCAVALQSARLLAARQEAEKALRQTNVRLEEQSRTVETLRNVGLALTSELALPALLQRVTDAATELSGAEFGAFFYNVLNETGEADMLYVISGVSPGHFSSFPIPRNTAIFEPTFRGEGVVRSDDIMRDVRYGHNPPYHGMPSGHLPVRSYLAHPVMARNGEVLGGLFFGHKEVGVFGEREERLAAGIAAHAAIAIENARLYEAEHRARSEAEQAVRARDEFLGIASHELRNPLAGLRAAVQLLLRWRSRGPVDAERLDRFLGEISRAADRLSGLLEDLLDVSRLRTGRLQLRLEMSDLAELVRESIVGCQRQAPEREIHLAGTSEQCQLLVDPDRVQQVIENLVSNAMKYSPEGGLVEVHIAAEPDGVLLSVKDSGIGLPADSTETIFEPFGRAANAQAKHIPGMGLGLYICRQIVQSHGGRIWAESAGEARGTTVNVWLPRQ